MKYVDVIVKHVFVGDKRVKLQGEIAGFHTKTQKGGEWYGEELCLARSLRL